MNKKFKFALILFVTIISQSCAGTYFYENQSYQSKDAALNAQQLILDNLRSQIEPFEKPLVEKKLIVLIPTKENMYAEYVLRGSKQGRPLSGDLDYSAQSFYCELKNIYECIKKKNIYKTVELNEGSFSSIIQPSTTFDTFCAYSSGDGDAIWYMLNVKNGKQVFSFDHTLKGFARLESFLSSIKAFALQ